MYMCLIGSFINWSASTVASVVKYIPIVNRYILPPDTNNSNINVPDSNNKNNDSSVMGIDKADKRCYPLGALAERALSILLILLHNRRKYVKIFYILLHTSIYCHTIYQSNDNCITMYILYI